MDKKKNPMNLKTHSFDLSRRNMFYLLDRSRALSVFDLPPDVVVFLILNVIMKFNIHQFLKICLYFNMLKIFTLNDGCEIFQNSQFAPLKILILIGNPWYRQYFQLFSINLKFINFISLILSRYLCLYQ